MPSALKEEKLQEIKEILSENSNFVLTTYKGLTVDEISGLRAQIREKGSRVKVIKNRLFRLAMQQSEEHSGIVEDFTESLKGPVAVTFSGESFPEVAKVLVEYSKKNEKVAIKSGCLDGSYLNEADVKAIATLPSKEELLAVIGRGLNTPATKIATGINEIMASLARGIRAVGEKNGD